MLILTVSGLKVLGPSLAQGPVSRRLTVNNPNKCKYKSTNAVLSVEGVKPSPHMISYEFPLRFVYCRERCETKTSFGQVS